MSKITRLWASSFKSTMKNGLSIKQDIRQLFVLAIFFIIPFQGIHRLKLSHAVRCWIYPEAFLDARIGKKLYFYPSDFLILTLALASFIYYRKALLSFFFHRERGLLSMFILWCLITFSLSDLPRTEQLVIRTFDICFMFLLFCSFTVFVNIDKEKLFKQLAWGGFLTSLVSCAIGIGHYFLQAPLGFHFLGEPKWLVSGFSIPDGSLWIGDRLFAAGSEAIVQRAHGTFPHPNIFGGYLLIPILLTTFLIHKEKKRLFKALLVLGLYIQIFSLLATFSRAALYALGLSLAVFYFLVLLKKERIFKLLLLHISSLLLATFLLLPQIKQRGGIVNYSSVAKHADNERVILQKAAIAIITDYPWMGTGYNKSMSIQENYYGDLQPDQHAPVHNIFLLIAMETGLIGLGLFVCFLLLLGLPHLRHLASLEVAIPFAAILVGFLFIGCCDFYLFANPIGKVFFFSVLGLFSLFSRLECEKASTSKSLLAQNAYD